MAAEYLTVNRLVTKDLIRIFSRIRIGPEQWNGTPCWNWTGYRRPKGYGRVSLRYGAVDLHRFMYAWLVGPIPKGKIARKINIDHLCRNTSCGNPLHLELVPIRINLLRGNSPSAIAARRTHCKNGHPLAGPNLRSRRGCRECITCSRAYARKATRKYSAKSVKEVNDLPSAWQLTAR